MSVLQLLLFFNFVRLIIADKSALWEASFVADVAHVKFVVSMIPKIDGVKAIDINYADSSYGRNALMICGFDPQVNPKLDDDCSQIAELLIDVGYNVSWVDFQGWNPLMMGASRGFTQFCSVLLRRATDKDSIINHQNFEGKTSLMLASINGHLHTFDLLMSNGARIDIQDNNGISALHLAVLRVVSNFTMTQAVQLLHSAASAYAKNNLLELRDKDNRTALMYAAIGLSGTAIQVLLQYGADPTVRDSYQTSVYDACNRNQTLQRMVAEATADWSLRAHNKWIEMGKKSHTKATDTDEL